MWDVFCECVHEWCVHVCYVRVCCVFASSVVYVCYIHVYVLTCVCVLYIGVLYCIVVCCSLVLCVVVVCSCVELCWQHKHPLASPGLCSNLDGQIMVDVMVKPPRPGDGRIHWAVIWPWGPSDFLRHGKDAEAWRQFKLGSFSIVLWPVNWLSRILTGRIVRAVPTRDDNYFRQSEAQIHCTLQLFEPNRRSVVSTITRRDARIPQNRNPGTWNRRGQNGGALSRHFLCALSSRTHGHLRGSWVWLWAKGGVCVCVCVYVRACVSTVICAVPWTGFGQKEVCLCLCLCLSMRTCVRVGMWHRHQCGSWVWV